MTAILNLINLNLINLNLINLNVINLNLISLNLINLNLITKFNDEIRSTGPPNRTLNTPQNPPGPEHYIILEKGPCCNDILDMSLHL